MRKILYVLITSITFVILLFNILSIYHVPFVGLQLFKVSSGSMEPTIKISNLIIVKRTSDFKEGDIVTYKRGSEYITHRIVDIQDEQIITKGDANNTTDRPIKRNQIIGKYIYQFKIVTVVNYVFNNPFNILFMLITALALVLMYRTIRQ